MKKREEALPLDNTFKAIGIALAVLGMVITVSCAARQLMSRVPPFAFPIPIDACIVDWKPVVLMQNTGTRTQAYLRNDGARVTVTYTYSDLTGAISERASEVWFDGECSAAYVKGNG